MHPKSGTNTRATRVGDGAAIYNTQYHWRARHEREAAYLVTLLHAPVLRPVFDLCRCITRHFDLMPWEMVPIPKFDGENPTHRELAELSLRAEGLAEAWLQAHGSGFAGQVRASERIRGVLDADGVSAALDRCAGEILPEQVAAVHRLQETEPREA